MPLVEGGILPQTIRALASAISEYLSDSPPTYLDTVALQAGVADHNHGPIGAEMAVRNHRAFRSVQQACNYQQYCF